MCALMFAAAGYADVNLHNVRWGEVAIPGSVCAADTRTIRLHDGTAFTRTRRGPPWIVEVDSRWNPVVYGHLGRKGRDPAAALVVNCNNGGGTAAGVLAYAQVIFSGADTSLRVVGVVTPRVQRAGQLPTLVTVTIRPGEVIAHESW